MRLKLRFLAFSIALASFNFESQAIAEDERSSFDKIINEITNFRPMLSPGSRGTFGSQIGFHQDSISLEGSGKFKNYHLGSVDDESNLTIRSMQWTKGTSLPMDFAFSLGQDNFKKLTIGKALLQWTVYEGFKLPSLTVRAIYKQVYDFQNLNARRIGVQGSIGQTLFSFFTIYGNISASEHQHRYKNIQINEQLALVQIPSEQVEITKIDYRIDYGIEIRLYLPYLKINLENTATNLETTRDTSVSVSLGY